MRFHADDIYWITRRRFCIWKDIHPHLGSTVLLEQNGAFMDDDSSIQKVFCDMKMLIVLLSIIA